MSTQNHQLLLNLLHQSNHLSQPLSNRQQPQQVDRQVQRILNPSQSTKQLLQNDFQQKISQIQDSLTSRSNFLALFQQMLQHEIQHNTFMASTHRQQQYYERCETSTNRQQQYQKRCETRTNRQQQYQERCETSTNRQWQDQESNQRNHSQYGQQNQYILENDQQLALLGINSSIKVNQNQCNHQVVSTKEDSRLDTHRTFTQDIINHAISPSTHQQGLIDHSINSTINTQSANSLQNHLKDYSTQTDPDFNYQAKTPSKLSNHHNSLNSPFFNELTYLKAQTKQLKQEKNKLGYFVGQVFNFLKSFLLDQIFRKGLLSIVQTVQANYQLKYQHKIAEIQKYHQQLNPMHWSQQGQRKNDKDKLAKDKFQRKDQRSEISLGSTISMRSVPNAMHNKSFNSHVSQFDNLPLHAHNKDNHAPSLNTLLNQRNTNNVYPLSNLKSLRPSQPIKYNSQEPQLISFRPSQSIQSKPNVNQNPTTQIHPTLLDSQTTISPRSVFPSNLSQQHAQKAFSSITIKPKPLIVTDESLFHEQNHQPHHIVTKTPKHQQTSNHPLRQVYLNEKAQQQIQQKKPFSKNNPSKNKLFFKTKSLSSNQAQVTSLKSIQDCFKQSQSSMLKSFKNYRNLLQRVKNNNFTLSLPVLLPPLSYKANPPTTTTNSIYTNTAQTNNSTYITYENNQFSYQGHTLDSKFHGMGRLFLKSLNICYQGEFEEHYINGKGSLAVVVGEAGQMRGKGKENIENGQFSQSRQSLEMIKLIVTGNFCRNQLNGYGKITIRQQCRNRNELIRTKQSKDKLNAEMPYHNKTDRISNQIYTKQTPDELFGLWKNNQLIGIV